MLSRSNQGRRAAIAFLGLMGASGLILIPTAAVSRSAPASPTAQALAVAGIKATRLNQAEPVSAAQAIRDAAGSFVEPAPSGPVQAKLVMFAQQGSPDFEKPQPVWLLTWDAAVYPTTSPARTGQPITPHGANHGVHVMPTYRLSLRVGWWCTHRLAIPARPARSLNPRDSPLTGVGEHVEPGESGKESAHRLSWLDGRLGPNLNPHSGCQSECSGLADRAGAGLGWQGGLPRESQEASSPELRVPEPGALSGPKAGRCCAASARRPRSHSFDAEPSTLDPESSARYGRSAMIHGGRRPSTGQLIDGVPDQEGA